LPYSLLTAGHTILHKKKLIHQSYLTLNHLSFQFHQLLLSFYQNYSLPPGLNCFPNPHWTTSGQCSVCPMRVWNLDYKLTGLSRKKISIVSPDFPILRFLLFRHICLNNKPQHRVLSIIGININKLLHFAFIAFGIKLHFDYSSFPG